MILMQLDGDLFGQAPGRFGDGCKEVGVYYYLCHDIGSRVDQIRVQQKYIQRLLRLF